MRPEGLFALMLSPFWPSTPTIVGSNILRNSDAGRTLKCNCVVGGSDSKRRNQIKKGPLTRTLFDLARPEGFEPPTTWFVARYSIQLSYGRNL